MAGLIGATIVFWASAPTGIRIGLTFYSPELVALYRFVVASAFFLVFALVRGIKPPSLKDVPAIFALGFFGVSLHHLALNYGQLSVSAGAASFLAQLTPLFTAFLSTLFLREEIGLLGWVGVILGLSGAAVIMLGDAASGQVDPTAFLILLAALSWSIYFILLKPMLRRHSVIDLTIYSVWAGTVIMFAFIWQHPAPISRPPLWVALDLIYLGIFLSALAYLTWSYAIQRLPVYRVSTFMYLVPPVAVVIAWQVIDEIPDPIMLIGGTMAVAGIGVVQFAAKGQGTDRRDRIQPAKCMAMTPDQHCFGKDLSD